MFLCRPFRSTDKDTQEDPQRHRTRNSKRESPTCQQTTCFLQNLESQVERKRIQKLWEEKGSETPIWRLVSELLQTDLSRPPTLNFAHPTGPKAKSSREEQNSGPKPTKVETQKCLLCNVLWKSARRVKVQERPNTTDSESATHLRPPIFTAIDSMVSGFSFESAHFQLQASQMKLL